MGKFKKIEKVKDSPDFLFYCPGCECDHGVWTTESNGNKAIWTFNNNLESPTISPSLKVRMSETHVCHSFIKDGKIQYLSDCTHALANQTVDIPAYL